METEIIEMARVCFEDAPGWMTGALAFLGGSWFAGLAANKFGKGTLVGKALNLLANNFTVEKK